MQQGDLLRIERRVLVNGALTTLTDTGRFRGVEMVGSSEHLVLQEARRKTLRLIPLATIAEIAVVRATRSAVDVPAGLPPTPSGDPAFG